MATNECMKAFLSIKNYALDIGILYARQCTPIYNNNQACVNWTACCTSKGTKHLNLHENHVHECHQDKTAKVMNIPGIINRSDIFMKELCDGTHFRCLPKSTIVSTYFPQIPSHCSDPCASIRTYHTMLFSQSTQEVSHSLPGQAS